MPCSSSVALANQYFTVYACCQSEIFSICICIRLWSHYIRIWPIFYPDIHGRQRQNKQMRLSKWRRSQWHRAALTCTEMFRRRTAETKSFCFFPAVYASVSRSFVLRTSMPCYSEPFLWRNTFPKITLFLYTGCPRRNVRDFGRVFLRSNYTDITQNTYIQS
jgi:hypothetical protein